MQIEVLTIGNELLNGDLADTNTSRLAGLLRGLGLPVRRAQTVPDTLAVVVDALKLAAGRADVVLVSGGLGPTEDDLTLEAAAAFAGVPLVQHDATLERLHARFAARGVPFTPNNARQAQVPAGAEVFENPVGTAPHVQLQVGTTRLFFFPGVPSELARLADDYLVPWLRAHAPVRGYRSHIFKTFGRTESQVATMLDGLPRDPRMHVAYRAHIPEIQVSLHVEDADRLAGAALLDSAAAHVRQALGDIIYSEDPKATFVSVVTDLLAARGQTLATAESCTGGLVAKMLTDRAGSSAWFKEGVVTYANEAKVARLGVDPALIAAHGAVSEAVCRAMADGVRETTGADWGLSVTGIAGPSGGSDGKPVGLTYLGLAGPDRATRVVERRWPFDRERNRLISAYGVLDMLRRALVI
ncbi:MAG: competence/damage-inducible protein A [Myxococcota bacterium]